MPQIILTRNVQEYRATIPTCVGPRDSVLEIGCAWGNTSALLQRRAGTLLAIDKSQSLATARQRHPEVHFEQLDGRQIGEILRFRRAFSVIYIDISGSRPIPAVLDLLERHRAVFKPRCMVVKSNRLVRLFGQCTIWQ